jgi:NitT/TauT family transport system permease protein
MNLREKIRNWAIPTLAVVLFFLIWEGIVLIFHIPKFVLPAPSVVIRALWQWGRIIAWHSGQTLYTTILGFSIAVIVGLVLGWAVGFSAMLYKALYPLLIAFNSIPKVAIVPILVIWFGIGTIPAVLTAFLISFFPILVNVATGLATLEPELRDVLLSLGATQFQIFRKVGLPRTLPYFFGSLKVAVTMAFVGSVISETVASNRGIGYLMIAASSRFDVPLVFAGLLAIALMGVGLYAIAAILEARLTRWAYRR